MHTWEGKKEEVLDVFFSVCVVEIREKRKKEIIPYSAIIPPIGTVISWGLFLWSWCGQHGKCGAGQKGSDDG